MACGAAGHEILMVHVSPAHGESELLAVMRLVLRMARTDSTDVTIRDELGKRKARLFGVAGCSGNACMK